MKNDEWRLVGELKGLPVFPRPMRGDKLIYPKILGGGEYISTPPYSPEWTFSSSQKKE